MKDHALCGVKPLLILVIMASLTYAFYMLEHSNIPNGTKQETLSQTPATYYKKPLSTRQTAKHQDVVPDKQLSPNIGSSFRKRQLHSELSSESTFANDIHEKETHQVKHTGISKSVNQASPPGSHHPRYSTQMATVSNGLSVSHPIAPNLLSEKAVKSIFTFENVPFYHYELNATRAQTMAMYARVPEPRTVECQQRTYPGMDHFRVSIIIPFHNELWAVLVRCIYSIIYRTPYQLIHEIILIDDASSETNLAQPLSKFVSLTPKTRLLRLSSHEGLMRARMVGARIATGDILVFMDAHIECTVGWLPPLLYLIKQQPTTIAIPVVDSLNPSTLAYFHPTYTLWGTFSWELDFVWRDGYERFSDMSDPYNTVTMIGCAFAVRRDTFFDFGGYDEGMNVWGGENLEISFRTWLCGGALKIVPCSHIGHIYRARLPYLSSSEIMYRNLQRVAEVWMGEYQQLYFKTTGLRYNYSKDSSLLLEQRKQLREKLNCKPFDWLLKNIATGIMVPPKNATMFGQMKNVQSCLCMTSDSVDVDMLHFQYCSFHDHLDWFSYFVGSGQIVHSSGKCVTVINQQTTGGSTYTTTPPPSVQLRSCHPHAHTQLWTFKKLDNTQFLDMLKGVDRRQTMGMFLWHNTSLCLTQEADTTINSTIIIETCHERKLNQKWLFTHTDRS